MAKSHPVLSEWYESRRLAGRNFTCVLCSQRWNQDDMKLQDGQAHLRVCTHCFEENGGEFARQLDRAAASELAAALTESEARPPIHPGWFEPSVVSAVTSFTPEPLRLTRGGVSAVMTVTGTGFQSSDVIAYSSGISDAAARIITSTSVQLTLQATLAAAVGDHSITYNDILYRRVIVAA